METPYSQGERLMKKVDDWRHNLPSELNWSHDLLPDGSPPTPLPPLNLAPLDEI